MVSKRGLTTHGQMATDNHRFTTVRQSFARSHPTLLALKTSESLACVRRLATRPDTPDGARAANGTEPSCAAQVGNRPKAVSYDTSTPT